MSVPPNFDRLAKIYRWMELVSFGPLLWRYRCAFLRQIGSRRKALALGDGDGRFTAKVLAENTLILIDAVDASAAMLAELKRRAGPNASRVTLHLADERIWMPKQANYDLIVTHFFLDCFTTEEVESIASRVRACAAPEAIWIVSEFTIPGGWFGSFVARPLVAFLYWAFGLLTGLKTRAMPDYREALARAGFTLEEEQRRLLGLLVSELWMISS
jgi:ubiquinone/menaquinone biosynthesis C-methylase UbiE